MAFVVVILPMVRNGTYLDVMHTREAPMAFKAELLKKKLQVEGKSRDELAAKLKKHKRTVSRWQAGTNPPKPKDLEAIAQHTGHLPP